METFVERFRCKRISMILHVYHQISEMKAIEKLRFLDKVEWMLMKIYISQITTILCGRGCEKKKFTRVYIVFT